MARAPVGQRIRKRRQELGLSQMELAARLGISSSYLNLIEHNKRALGGALLHRIAEAIHLDSRSLAGTEEARLIAELAEVGADTVLTEIGIGQEDAREIVAMSPKAARAVLTLYRAYQEARHRSDLIGERLGEDSFLAEASQQILSLITTIRSYSEILKDYGDLSQAERKQFEATLVEESERLATRASDMFDFMGGRGVRRPRPSPREEIEDFISDHANYFPRLESVAERTLSSVGDPSPALETLLERLRKQHGARIIRRPADELPPEGERYDEGARELHVADVLERASVRFRVARLIGALEHGGLLDEVVGRARLSSPDASARLRRALASYFAGALIMPYAAFREAVAAFRLDVLRLARRFEVSFEQASHRLTTLRRPGAEGIPLHFVRTDIAGNISKRFSASGFRLPRYGGACPRWIVHHAFAAPGRVVTQIGRLPNGETYFFIAHAEPFRGQAGLLGQNATMIGAAIAHVGEIAYADGIDFASPSVAIPIGITCRQCPRANCAQRAFEYAMVPNALI